MCSLSFILLLFLVVVVFSWLSLFVVIMYPLNSFIGSPVSSYSSVKLLRISTTSFCSASAVFSLVGKSLFCWFVVPKNSCFPFFFFFSVLFTSHFSGCWFVSVFAVEVEVV